MDDLGAVLRGGWGAGCWCLHPRLTATQVKALPGDGGESARRRRAMTTLAGRAPAPGLLAYRDGEPVCWVAVAPRAALARIAASRATPPVDAQDVWVIPCVTVRKDARGQGVAVGLIEAAVAFAGQHGASIVEAYPRAGDERTKDDNVFYGTEALFRRAGFSVARGPLADRPRTWPARLAMRCATGA